MNASGIEFLQSADHHGVQARIPQRVAVLSSALPLSWTKRKIEVTCSDGSSVRGTLLAVSTCGLVMVARLSKDEAVRRQISWHHIVSVDLDEESPW